METKNNFQNLYWEERLFEGLIKKLFFIYKKLWFVIVLLWISSIALGFIYKSWVGGIFVFSSMLIPFPMAALGHATQKRDLGRGYGNFIGRVLRVIYCYLLSIIGYTLIVLLPISFIISTI